MVARKNHATDNCANNSIIVVIIIIIIIIIIINNDDDDVEVTRKKKLCIDLLKFYPKEKTKHARDFAEKKYLQGQFEKKI